MRASATALPMPVPAPVTRATLCDAAMGWSSSYQRVALSSLHLPGRNAVVSRRAAKSGSETMRRREVLGLGLAALSAPLVTPRASAQVQTQAKFPERPIRLVIPFPPGGVNDAIGRPWADKMKPLLGTVVIE